MSTHAAAGSAIQKYMDGKISSSEYFREVKKDTSREVKEELKKSEKEKSAA